MQDCERLRVHKVALKEAASRANDQNLKVDRDSTNSVLVLTSMARAAWADDRRATGKLLRSRKERGRIAAWATER